MSDNDANNSSPEKEIMKINNVDVSFNKWIDSVTMLSEIADNTMHGKDKVKELYRDYKQSNIDYAKDRLKKEIDMMRPCSILDGMNLKFIRRKENQELLSKLDKVFSNALKEYSIQGVMDVNNYNLDNFEERILALFNRKTSVHQSIIDISMFPSELMKEEKREAFLSLRNSVKPIIEDIIENVKKDDILMLNEFLRSSRLNHLKTTVNTQILIEENEKLKEIFGINSDDRMDVKTRRKLDNKLRIIHFAKRKFIRELSNMTPDMIAGNINKLVGVQTNIMALEDVAVHNGGFKHLGLFTSDISNAISNNEMNRTNGFFNTARIDNSKREKVLNNYKGEELVKEYKKLMMGELKVDYEILELVPKWYNMINGGAKTKEAVISINSDIGGIMDDIKKKYNLKMNQEVAKEKTKTELKSENPEPKEEKDESENTSSSNSPSKTRFLKQYHAHLD